MVGGVEYGGGFRALKNETMNQAEYYLLVKL